MQRLLEYLAHHPYMSGGAVFIAILVIANEIRERMQAFAAVGSGQAVQMMNQGALVLDVRTKDVYDAGHIGDARNVAAAELAGNPDAFKKWREKNVIVYCDTGMSGAGAARTLTKLGFTKVFNLSGGLDGWRKENLPVVKSAASSGARR